MARSWFNLWISNIIPSAVNPFHSSSPVATAAATSTRKASAVCSRRTGWNGCSEEAEEEAEAEAEEPPSRGRLSVLVQLRRVFCQEPVDKLHVLGGKFDATIIKNESWPCVEKKILDAWDKWQDLSPWRRAGWPYHPIFYYTNLASRTCSKFGASLVTLKEMLATIGPVMDLTMYTISISFHPTILWPGQSFAEVVIYL